MRNRKHARGLSLLLCAVLLAGQPGTTIYAEGTASDTEGLCEHHPEHTTECGYVEAVEGHRCEHVHTDGCYTDELICGYDDEDMELAADSDAAHEHTPKCYKLDCPHERGEHDKDCGYVEAVKGQPCAFVCDECNKKEPEADSGNNPPAPDLPEPDHKQPEEAEIFTITDFDGLDEAVQYQTVSPGTKLDELNLPATLRASGYTVTDNTEPTPEPITIQGVTWEPDEAYDDTAEQGSYIFTPVLPDGYTRATGVELPEIYVRIGWLATNLDYDDSVYSKNDVDAINAIIDYNGLSATKDDLASWQTAGLVEWNRSTPKRITRLSLNSKDLRGQMDLGSLTELTYLSCHDNKLTALKGLDKLTKLTKLYCGSNPLSALDVSKNKNLTDLYCRYNDLAELDLSANMLLTALDCSSNKLTALDLSRTWQLVSLDCNSNELTALDLSDLTYLNALDCSDNPLASFKTKSGQILTINQTTGGTVRMTAYTLSSNTITYTAKPDTGYSFQSWINPPDGAEQYGNEIRFKPMTGYSTVEAAFISNYDPGDVAAVNAMYDDNYLTAGTRNDLSTWTFVIWDNGSPKRITGLNLSGKSLSGTLDVGKLTELTYLNCSDTQLSALDVSKNTNLTYLNCSDTQLSALDVSKNTNLTQLDCSNTLLSELDVSKNNLTQLDCSNIQLSALDVSKNTNLTHLYCSNTQLSALDVSKNTNLTQLYCGNTQLSALNVSNNTNLTYLYCSNNPFASFTTKDGHTLTVNQTAGGTVWTAEFTLNSNTITLTAKPDSGNSFQSWINPPDGAEQNGNDIRFKLTGNNTVEAAFINTYTYDPGDVAAVNAIYDDNHLAEGTRNDPSTWTFVVWDNGSPKRITSLDLSGKSLSGTLDVGKLTELTDLNCSNTQLSALEVSKNTNLTYLSCSNTKLSALDVSKNTNLTYLSCSHTRLSALDVSKNTNLTQLYCLDTQLSALDLAKNTNLDRLDCSDTQLSVLDVSKNTNLTYLFCENTPLSALDLSKNTLLVKLYCSDTPLSALDLSKNTLLVQLLCENTQLSALDLSKNTLLGILECSDNPLSSFTPKVGHTLTVNKTTGGTVWTTDFDFSNNKITLEARPDTDFSFQEWTKLPDGIKSDTNTVSFTLDGNRTVAANFRSYKPSTDATLQNLSLSDGITLDPAFHSAITEYKASVGNATDTITITATSGDSKAVVDGDGKKTLKVGPNKFTITVTSEDKTSSQQYTVTITREDAARPSGGGNKSGGNDSSQSYTITTPQPPKPNNPVLAEIELPVTVGNGTAAGQLDDGRTAGGIAEAQKNGKAGRNGIALQYRAKTSTAYDGFSITIRRATFERFIDAKVKYVTLDTGIADLTFDLAALQEIQKQATGDVTLTAARETGLTGDMLAAVGTRPAYRLTVGYTGQDGKAAFVTSFGAGRVTVRLAYKPAADEQTGSLFLVYSKDGKNTEWLYQSSYDLSSGNLIGSTGHFSVYGVGYKPAPAYADTVNHWAKADIDFAASRGLLAETGEATFTPDGTMTRGMFVAALGRLAGIDPAAYPSSRFSDVAATAYYAPYVEWAFSNGIIIGAGEKTFAPDAAVTREEMAVMMKRYAAVMGYILPIAREAEIFTDNNKITGSMKSAVQTMQQAGVMNSKGNHLFAPKDIVTRAEAAAILRRFVEIVIDPASVGYRTTSP